MRIIKKILNSSYKRINTFFGSGFSVERSYDLKWLIDWSNRVDKKMTFKLFEDDQISYFINNYKKYKPEYFLDIGAHGGLYSIILKNKFPKLNVWAFEPDRQNRYQFYGNLFLNNFEREIEVYNFGLSSNNKEVAFGIVKDGNRGGKTIMESGELKINVKPLDEVFLEKSKICFVKIDVEGHELDVIKGSIKFLKNNFCLIQVEISHEDSLKEFDIVMNKLGYSLVKKIDDYYYSNIN
tara:strand:+ start:1183 stop:1896 length:714 start_codon:yes stop_codon:yes gene_type:complete